jgi:hypothetical protein
VSRGGWVVVTRRGGGEGAWRGHGATRVGKHGMGRWTDSGRWPDTCGPDMTTRDG